MKNETISRVILVLEIAAIILFHSLKSSSNDSNKIAHSSKEPNPIVLHQSTQLVLTSK